MTIERSTFSWTHVVALTVAYVGFDQFLIAPLFASLFGLASPEAAIVQRLGWATLSAFIVVVALAFLARRVQATGE